MAKVTYPSIDSGLEAWDSEINDVIDILESGPIPLFEGSQPNANQNDRSIMAVDQGGGAWRIEFSNGTTWLIIPVQASAVNDLTDNSGGTSGGDTIAVITDTNNAGSADLAPTRNAIATLAAKVNALLAARRTAHQQA